MILISLVTTILTTFRMVFIPAEFKDCSFSETSLETLQSQVELCQDYYNREFHGVKGYTNFSFELTPIVSLSQNKSYYAYNYTDRKDILLYQALKDACNLSKSINFSQFDNSSKGEVDVVCVIFSGQDELSSGDENSVYPQFISLRDYNTSLRLNNKNIDKFVAVCEDSSYGIICHELAHFWGLPDFYDTDYEASGALCSALEGLSLMDEGCKRDGGQNPASLTALEYDVLGLGECVSMTCGQMELHSFSQTRQYIKAENKNNPNEYYLFDYEEDEGLRIFYVDKSNTVRGYSTHNQKLLTAAQRWQYNEINTNPDHLCAKRVRIKANSFGSDTDSPFRYYDNSAYPYAIINIKDNCFDVIEPLVLKELAVYQDAAIIRWDYDPSFENPPFEISWDNDNKEIIKGQYYSIEGLKANSLYHFTIKLIANELEAYSISSSFTTKSYNKNTKPYIYLSATQRNKDGSFPLGAKIPLRIYNAQNIAKTTWVFNSSPVTTDTNGYFVVKEEGTLKAIIEYEDGNREIIIKEIRL